MRIRLAFQDDPNGELMPCLIAAYDEYTEDAWNRTPDFYTEELDKAAGNGRIRELDVKVLDSVVLGLFETPSVDAEVVKEPTPEPRVVRETRCFS